MNEELILDPNKSADDSAQWTRKWTTDAYIEKARQQFNSVDSYLNFSPLKILDIGCGFAYQSRWFNEKYNSELWLLDGDNSSNTDLSSYGNWNENSEELKFYHSLSFLDLQLKKLGTNNYHLVDSKNINIPKDIKYDLITSYLSCGYHYPVKTYRDLILKHSHENTRIVIDIRTKGTSDNFKGVDRFKIVNIIEIYGKKRSTVEIKLI